MQLFPLGLQKMNTPNDITDIKGTCPRCKADWKGWEIPEKDRHHYAPLDADPSTYPTHGSRLIGMEDRDIYDGAHSWKCPDCAAIEDARQRRRGGILPGYPQRGLTSSW